MEISGKIIEVLPIKSGQSANGTWRKQEYVLETEGQYPRKVCFMAWGDKIDQFEIKHGEHISAAIDLESREYNGRWYTDVKAWKVTRAGSDSYDSMSSSGMDEPGPSSAYPLNDDIPF